MRDKSSTFLLCRPGYIALRTPLGTPSPDKDTWDAMADEVPCELWQPRSIALTGGHMGIWNNKALWSTFSQVGCNNLKKWETDGGNGRSWEKITSPQTSPREAKHKGSTGDEKRRLMCGKKIQHLERGVKSIFKIFILASGHSCCQRRVAPSPGGWKLNQHDLLTLDQKYPMRST